MYNMHLFVLSQLSTYQAFPRNRNDSSRANLKRVDGCKFSFLNGCDSLFEVSWMIGFESWCTGAKMTISSRLDCLQAKCVPHSLTVGVSLVLNYVEFVSDDQLTPVIVYYVLKRYNSIPNINAIRKSKYVYAMCPFNDNTPPVNRMLYASYIKRTPQELCIYGYWYMQYNPTII